MSKSIGGIQTAKSSNPFLIASNNNKYKPNHLKTVNNREKSSDPVLWPTGNHQNKNYFARHSKNKKVISNASQMMSTSINFNQIDFLIQEKK